MGRGKNVKLKMQNVQLVDGEVYLTASVLVCEGAEDGTMGKGRFLKENQPVK
jgi:hypothetical protein